MEYTTNKPKLFKWEGWKKEVIWIFFFIFLLFTAYAYYTETKKCRDNQQTDCYKKCITEEFTRQYIEDNPGQMINCDWETLLCTISGMGGYNFSIDGG